MNDNNGLTPDNQALRHFFQDDILYMDPEMAGAQEATEAVKTATKLPEKEIRHQFDGNFSSDILMLFRHDYPEVLYGSWGEMLQRLICNETALNRNMDQVCRLNLTHNPALKVPADFGEFLAPDVLVWGNSGLDWIDRHPEFTVFTESGKKFLVLREASSYETSKERKMELWKHLKAFFA